MPPDATPNNGNYMVAAYIVAGVIYLLYALSLWVRAGRSNKNSG
ncbi:MAG: hypothetical protein ABI613_02990 [Gemmatimonadota bacterium]